MQEPAIQKQVFEWLVLTIIGAKWPRPLTFVIPLGFEPKTHSLEGCCSIQLSYGTVRLTVRGARPRGKGLQIYDFSLNLHHFLLSLHGFMKITEAIFAGSSTRVDQRPKERLPEVAFIGRSNVGKSSLINMLTGSKKLAMTSATPGKTKLVNHFRINGSWYLVDLPGYGYAKLPEKEKEKLQAIISDYLNHSEELKHLFVLVDSRHDMQKADVEFITEVAGSTIPFSLIFTKGDKMGPVARERQIEANLRQLEPVLDGAKPECFASSSETGLGREEILNYINKLLKTN